jgi:hypothetical protein
MALDRNDTQEIAQILHNILLPEIDKKFKEQNSIIDLKLEALELKIEQKGMIWAEKTVKDILKTMGMAFDDFQEVQADLSFLRGLRKLCSNVLTKAVITVGGIFGITFCIEYLRSKGIK